MANHEPKGTRTDWDKVARLFLRSIPVLPGPEIYDLLKDLQSSRTELGDKVKRAASALEAASKLVAETRSRAHDEGRASGEAEDRVRAVPTTSDR